MLKKLKKQLKSELKDKNIFDIIIYGSHVMGKISPSDIDIAVLFTSGNLRERLDKIQKIKNNIKENRLDIKQLTLTEFFSESSLSRQGILTSGISISKDREFAQNLGFKAYSLFSYSLKDHSHTNKVRFNYILSGRRGDKGILETWAGERISSGAIKIPIKNSLEFEEVLRTNKVKYKKKDILEAE